MRARSMNGDTHMDGRAQAAAPDLEPLVSRFKTVYDLKLGVARTIRISDGRCIDERRLSKPEMARLKPDSLKPAGVSPAQETSMQEIEQIAPPEPSGTVKPVEASPEQPSPLPPYRHLTVIEGSERQQGRVTLVDASCDCGRCDGSIRTYNLSDLKSGRKKSCGGSRGDRARAKKTAPGKAGAAGKADAKKARAGRVKSTRRGGRTRVARATRKDLAYHGHTAEEFDLRANPSVSSPPPLTSTTITPESALRFERAAGQAEAITDLIRLLPLEDLEGAAVELRRAEGTPLGFIPRGVPDLSRLVPYYRMLCELMIDVRKRIDLIEA